MKARSAVFEKDIHGVWSFCVLDTDGLVLYQQGGFETFLDADTSLKKLIRRIHDWCRDNPTTEPLVLPIASTPDLPWLRKWRD